MQIRVATPEDIPRLEQLEQAVIEAERPFNAAIKADNAHYYDLPALLNDEHSYLIVGTIDGSIIATGYAQIRHSKAQLDHAQHGYLGFMYVHPEHRGKGLNQQIMTKLMAWCNHQSVYDFYLDVYSDNAAAIRAYEKAGFRPCLLEMKLHQPVS
ncbi:GNAT family N-acetyltransferase [Pseudoalteromonas rubra]|uniref:GNAT family N-acetyltransferase n=1 Tax=Pseudoalteromonas rubra TaxID=43658 RepID=A0A5S3WPJ2_9GAMM|nr:GNAT family N-acetyltransferase [Pseudoalteromonas rubra]TMP30020.1 GNAT family N-acetyltransferase [Pseudoalteromonas rubra]TMP30600.1 GNAT family N-acetyltransferase [Pseudoalteromonas rubra]